LQAWYCDQYCQEAHWPRHVKVIIEIWASWPCLSKSDHKMDSILLFYIDDVLCINTGKVLTFNGCTISS
jgi:hypothetical protein